MREGEEESCGMEVPVCDHNLCGCCGGVCGNYECAVIPVLLVVAFSRQAHLPGVVKAKQVWKFICGSGLPGRKKREGNKAFAREEIQTLSRIQRA